MCTRSTFFLWWSSFVSTNEQTTTRCEAGGQQESARNCWNLDTLMKVVGEEIDAHKRAVPALPLDEQPRRPQARDSQPTAASLYMKGSTVSRVYCDQSHPSVSCTTVSDVESCKQRLKKAGRCFICLKRFHVGCNCHSTLHFSKCNGIMLASASPPQMTRKREPLHMSVSARTRRRTQGPRASQLWKTERKGHQSLQCTLG